METSAPNPLSLAAWSFHRMFEGGELDLIGMVRLSGGLRFSGFEEHGERLDQSKMHFPVADRVSRRELVYLPHEVFLRGREGVDHLVEALGKIQTNSGELSSDG